MPGINAGSTATAGINAANGPDSGHREAKLRRALHGFTRMRERKPMNGIGSGR
jgi:hypothetical protein